MTDDKPRKRTPGTPRRPTGRKSSTAGKAVDRATRDDRRAKVAELVLAGVAGRDIAKRLGVGAATVSRDLSAVRGAWQASAQDAIAEATAVELARLAHDERKLRASFNAYLSAGESVKACMVYDRILRVMERRSKILGLDQPTKVHVEATATRGDLFDHDRLFALSPEKRAEAVEAARLAIERAIEGAS